MNESEAGLAILVLAAAFIVAMYAIHTWGKK